MKSSVPQQGGPGADTADAGISSTTDQLAVLDVEPAMALVSTTLSATSSPSMTVFAGGSKAIGWSSVRPGSVEIDNAWNPS